MQFPWMMYCKGPGLPLPRGQSVSCKAAADEKDYAEAIKAGWYPSVPEALAEKLAAPAPEPAKADTEPVENPPQEIENETDEAPRRGRPRKS